MLPTGTVTMLFTDIEGSTQLLRRLGSRYAEALVDHDAILRQAIERWDGQVVGSRGDGLFAVFSRASDAVGATVTAQRAFANHPWPEGETLRVRMGLHTGEPRIIAAATGGGAEDYVGLDVHRAARIAASAHGGQVVLSEATEVLVAGELPEGVSLGDLGEHEFKDLPQPEHVYQLAIEGLPGAFPLLRYLVGPRHNLPIQLTSFIGRDVELAEIMGYLVPQVSQTGATAQGATTQGRPYDGGVRLLTLLGPGGTGKTRLALQAGLELLDHYPDGVWFADLSGLADCALTPQTVAGALGLRTQSERPLVETIAAYLERRELLLILDNCEHVLDGIACLVEPCLQAAPGLRILATSREPLSVRGEVTLPVPPLPLPDTICLPPYDSLARVDAVRLFVERARAVRPGFTLTEANAGAVAQICARLDGLPLAIELAAARIRVLNPEQIAAHLDDCLRLLTTGSRTAPQRQQTLEAAIDWSYRLLSVPEKMLFRRLSIFAGGWTLEAAEAATAGRRSLDQGERESPAGFRGMPGAGDSIEPYEVLDLLAHLVDQSLVVADVAGPSPRYRMLETILAFARARLAESGESETAARSHLAYFRRLAEEAAPHLEGWGQQGWLERLEMEHENFRRALRWGLDHRTEDAVRAAAALWYFWFVHGHLVEGRRWIEQALAVADEIGVSGRTLATLLSAASNFAGVRGELDAAAALAARDLAVAEEIGDLRDAGFALYWLAFAAAKREQPAVAEGLIRRVLELGRQSGDDGLSAMALAVEGVKLHDQGRLDEALPLLEEAARLSRAAGNESASLMPATNLAEIALLQGKRDLARELARDALALAHRVGDRHMVAWLLDLLGEVHRQDGALEPALEAYREALVIERELDVAEAMQSTLEGIARIYAAQEQPEDAARLLGAAEALRDRMGFPLAPAYLSAHEAGVGMVRGRLGDERLAAEWAHGRAVSLDDAIALAMAGS